MNRSLNILHAALGSIGVLFGLFVAHVAYQNYVEGRPNLTSVRAFLAFFLVTYALMQLWLTTNRQVRLIQFFAFPFFYTLLGIAIEFAGKGYIKNWAPGTAEEAFHSNIFFGALGVLVTALAVYLTFSKGSGAGDA